MRFVKSNSVIHALYNTGMTYAAPPNFTYAWNFGVYAFICLAVQIVSGILLAMHYVAEPNLAFSSVEHIMRDVNHGWLTRYVHANGASMFFIVVYVHMFRGLYYGSYLRPRQWLWISGVVILLLMILTAFMGYVLPWGQMSFWGATVITNMVSAVPVIGNDIVLWLWGGYSVGGPTLNRFFSLHYFLPFLILGLVILHVIILHEVRSNNPLGLPFQFHDQATFTPYYTIKDLVGIFGFLFFYALFLFFWPNTLGHPDNYIPANPLVTPPHIVPEWYFPPFYAILRSIPNKLAGVLAMLVSILILAVIPFLHTAQYRSNHYRPVSQVLFWFFVADCLVLGWIGSQPAAYPFIGIGQAATLFYFLYLLALLPAAIALENRLLARPGNPSGSGRPRS